MAEMEKVKTAVGENDSFSLLLKTPNDLKESGETLDFIVHEEEDLFLLWPMASMIPAARRGTMIS